MAYMHCTLNSRGSQMQISPMQIPCVFWGGRSTRFSANDTFCCHRVRAYQVTANSDGASNPGKVTPTAFHGRISTLWKISSEAFGSFPWNRLWERFIQRALDLLWNVLKWLAIPTLVLSSVNEFLNTLSAKKDICIPLGILTGVLVARIIGKTVLEALNDVQDETPPWPLVAMAVVFALLKLSGPNYPVLAAAFVPHVANAGLVQTALLFREWHRKSV